MGVHKMNSTKLVKFPVLSWFNVKISPKVKCWQRAAFSNPISAKEFVNLIMETSIQNHIKNVIYAKYGGWIIVGIGVDIPCYKFIEKYSEAYDSVFAKVGAVHLEAIQDFSEFLMSDWIDELGLVVFSEKLEDLFPTFPDKIAKLAKIKSNLKVFSKKTKASTLSEILREIYNEYLSLKPRYENFQKIFKIMKLIAVVDESVIKALYRSTSLGNLGSKTIGRLVNELIDADFLSEKMTFVTRRIVLYRNAIDHYDASKNDLYKFDTNDLEIALMDLCDMAEFALTKNVI